MMNLTAGSEVIYNSEEFLVVDTGDLFLGDEVVDILRVKRPKLELKNVSIENLDAPE